MRANDKYVQFSIDYVQNLSSSSSLLSSVIVGISFVSFHFVPFVHRSKQVENIIDVVVNCLCYCMPLPINANIFSCSAQKQIRAYIQTQTQTMWLLKTSKWSVLNALNKDGTVQALIERSKTVEWKRRGKMKWDRQMRQYSPYVSPYWMVVVWSLANSSVFAWV